MKKLTIAALAALLLSGCAITQPLVRFKFWGTDIPDNLIQDCAVTAPPAKDQYNSSTWPQKEELLQNALNGTYQDLSQCNTDKRGLRSWKSKQKTLQTEQESKSQ